MGDDGELQRVMEFITQNRLDERAAEALLSCPFDIQRTVVARGDLHGMNNPSSAVLGRIRQVKMRAEAEALRQGGAYGYGEQQVEEFIQSNTLDERAADCLRNAGAEVQYAVMSRGNLHDARNPSSAALGRIKEAQQKGAGRGYGVYQRAVDDALSATVKAFVASNNLDERAQDALMNSPADVVQAVIGRGGLQDAKNPSSAVLGRIKDAKAAGYGQTQALALTADPMAGAGYGFGAMFGGQTIEQEVENFIADGGVDERAAQAFRCAEDTVKRWIMGKGSVRDARNPSSALLARIKDGNSKMYDGMMASAGNMYGTTQMAWQFQAQPAISNVPIEQELAWFIQGSGIDDRAAEALMCQTAEVQRAVMARGSLADARNPSSAVLGRIKDANAELAVYGTTGSTSSQWQPQTMASVMVPNPLEEFCQEYKLDDRAIEALASSPPEVQSMVLAGGGLQTARNPSSAVLGRIREAQAKLGLTGAASPNNSQGLTDFSAAAASGSIAWVPFSSATTVEDQMEEFIANNSIDDRAAMAFRCCSTEIAQVVMSRGELRSSRNPSSALLGRIRDATNSVGYTSGGGGGSGSNFSYQETRSSLFEDVPSAPSDDLETFIAENSLDDRAAELFRNQTPEVQAAVMARGSLRDTRNPSSAVLGRIKDAQASQKQQSWGGGAYSSASSPSGPNGNVDDFIQENNIDERAAEVLKAASAEVQQAVLARGGLQDARNPSSAVLGRVRDAKQSLGGGSGSKSGGGSGRYQPY